MNGCVEAFIRQLRSDPDSCVTHANPHLIDPSRLRTCRLGNEPDMTRLRSELDRVVQQVHEHLGQAHGIAIDRHLFVRQ